MKSELKSPEENKPKLVAKVPKLNEPLRYVKKNVNIEVLQGREIL